jgi:hypothetical protein
LIKPQLLKEVHLLVLCGLVADLRQRGDALRDRDVYERGILWGGVGLNWVALMFRKRFTNRKTE